MSASIGPVIFDLEGTEITQAEKEILKNPLIGGVIFFARNYQSPQQITELAQIIRDIKQTPILITVDQEGGRVQRFQEGFTRIPPMGMIGKIYQESPEEGLRVANACGYIVAAELLEVGIDLSFAPVLDLSKVDNPVINDRAFSANPQTVISLARAFIAGMQEAGMASCGKHFPGHGSVSVDSHLALPIDERELSEIISEDLLPFVEIKLNSIMASHILFPKVDKTTVGFSDIWLKKILRDQLKFSGVVFSDCLSMKGAHEIAAAEKRAETALNNGCDMVLICNSRADVIKTLNYLPQDFKRVPFEKFSPLMGDFSKKKKSCHAKLLAGI